MKKSHLTKCITSYLILSLFLPFAIGAETDLDHRNVKAVIEGYLAENPEILYSSKDKDIVIFLGNTGAGKSTLIDYLSSQIALRVNNVGDIVLENPDDSSAMAIGDGGESKTFLPAFIQIGDKLFYDFPGFKDTRGTARSLVNACFIKQIIENARSVKLIFVVGIDQITTDRGSSFKHLLRSVKQLIPNKIIEDFSALIITKSHVDRDNISKFLEAKLTPSTEYDLYLLNAWIKNDHVEQMTRPAQNVIEENERSLILRLIKRITTERVKNVNIDVIFDINEQRKLNDIYNKEIADIVNNVIQNIQSLPEQDISLLEQKKNFIMNDSRRALDKALAVSPLLNLLRPVSESMYQASLNQQNQSLTFLLDKIVSKICVDIKALEIEAERARRIKAEKESEEKERQRIQAEKILIEAQQQARRAEAELEARRKKDEEDRKKAQAIQVSSNAAESFVAHDPLQAHKETSWRNYSNAVFLYRKYFGAAFSPQTGIYTHEGKANIQVADKILNLLAYGPGLPTKIAPANLGLTRQDFENWAVWSQWRNSYYDPYSF